LPAILLLLGLVLVGTDACEILWLCALYEIPSPLARGGIFRVVLAASRHCIELEGILTFRVNVESGK